MSFTLAPFRLRRRDSNPNHNTIMSEDPGDAAAPLLDREAVAKLVGVHPETITRASRAGKLPAIYLGHRLVRYKREDVDAWLESFRHQAPPASRKRNQGVPPS